MTANRNLFLLGLGLRLAMIAFVLPHSTAQWYAPFLDHSLSYLSFDPWTAFLRDGGTPLAFPYGYAMWLALFPLGLIAELTHIPMHFAYGGTLLLADTAMLWVLRRLTGAPNDRLLWLYWFSPLSLFATYWLGFNDIIPLLFLVLALAELRGQKILRASVFIALALSAKLTMILAAPFFGMYLFHNKRLRRFVPEFTAFSAIFCLGLLGVWFLSPGARFMLLHNPEAERFYWMRLAYGPDLSIFLLPLAYAVMLFVAWRVRRMSFDLLLTLLGTAFFLVLLLAPAAPGWFIWVLPFLVVYQVASDRVTIALVLVFSLLYLGLNVMLAPLPSVPLAGWPGGAVLAAKLNPPANALSMWQTMLLAVGLIVLARMLRDGVQQNEYFRLSRKPFLVGIAGDSGTGKDTLSEAIVALFGAHSSNEISGDDYHFWDRQKPMWQVMTHLNPRANDLARLTEDVRALANGQRILSRHYDHSVGRMTKPVVVDANDFIIVSGLHTLYTVSLRNLFDLSIFLGMDEDLRQHLKVARDVDQRGHAREAVQASIERRRPDAERFVRPQEQHADLVLSLRPIHSPALAKPNAPLRLKLCVRTRQGAYDEQLVRILIGICGLHVEVEMDGAAGSVELTIEGEATGADVELAAARLLPHLPELLDVKPKWFDGTLGVMQLIVLVQIIQSLRRRLV